MSQTPNGGWPGVPHKCCALAFETQILTIVLKNKTQRWYGISLVMTSFLTYPIAAPSMATYATAAYPAPYQQQPHHPRNYVPRPPPPNWVPPPFNGPPPIPSGITVNPQQWQAGFWKPNPAWNGARPTAQQQQQQQQQQQPQPQHTLWIPSQHWTHQQQKQQKPGARPQQQQAANFNPFKRVIHPPSAEYLATKLSDNPLGLIDMKPATMYVSFVFHLSIA